MYPLPSAGGYLVDRCSQDMWLLSGEIAKLCAYVGGGITKEAIDKVTTQAVDAGIYDLSRMILKGITPGPSPSFPTCFTCGRSPR